MPKITIHQEIWSKIREFVVVAIALFVTLSVTVVLYQVESLIFINILHIDMTFFIKAISFINSAAIVYHFALYMFKITRAATPKPPGSPEF